MAVEEQKIEVEGLPTRYLMAGEGPPLLLLHGVGDNALNWRWVMPTLGHTYRVYALDLPGSGGSAKPLADYSLAFFTRFVAAFLEALGIDRAAVVGNSLGGLVGLRLTLSKPERVTALGLVSSGGLGREVTYALRSLALPGYGKLAVAWGKRAPGAAQRALGRSTLLFARPWRAPRKWLEEQYRLARLPGFLEAQLATVRAQVELSGQREVLVNQLAHLEIPTLIMWGARDRVLPYSQGQEAVSHLREGFFDLIPDCGIRPTSRNRSGSYRASASSLAPGSDAEPALIFLLSSTTGVDARRIASTKEYKLSDEGRDNERESPRAESGIIVFGGGSGCSGRGCLFWILISVVLSITLTVVVNIFLYLL